MLNNINQANNTPAFKAELCVKFPVKDSVRLGNIKKLFAEKTPNFKDTLTMSFVTETEEEVCYLGKSLEKAFSVDLRTPFERMMSKLSDSEIADKLVKYLRGLKAINKREVALSLPDSDLLTYHAGYEKNKRIADHYREKGNDLMAERFEYMANSFAKKIKKIKDNETKIIADYKATIESIAEGDADILNMKKN